MQDGIQRRDGVLVSVGEEVRYRKADLENQGDGNAVGIVFGEKEDYYTE